MSITLSNHLGIGTIIFRPLGEMDSTILHIHISSLLRQLLNCWLAYVLSQPVDIDVPTMLHFIRDYFGVGLMWQFARNARAIVSNRLFGEDIDDAVKELVPQESYSYRERS